jgi:hypothetical protein
MSKKCKSSGKARVRHRRDRRWRRGCQTGLPGMFRVSISGTVYEQSENEPEVKWNGRTFVVGGESYRPIAFHDADAALVAEALSR